MANKKRESAGSASGVGKVGRLKQEGQSRLVSESR